MVFYSATRRIDPSSRSAIFLQEKARPGLETAAS